ncbi:GNAT family N-acetyltransferase [Mobilicoccus pelagius]|uniref:Putative ribosomal-protein-alanine acetyltransferase n=1 Tax=Mobilicoccus pelagius NBRC 104925 TaxID=1089455 RepID=H5UQE2_9MICO|nr:GNAT family N-acetyltransferase [Mobilicoccus pelagius]GAB47950.1 putative ribosomal-protein-alanine acetyltransferase [Mobilicoccus pelagius NBRC 104925]
MRPPVSQDALAARFAERGARLREMAWTDIPRLAQLEREAFADDAWSAQSWWAELAGRPRREYVVVTGRSTPDVADTLDEPDGKPDLAAETDDTAGTDAIEEEILGYAGLDHAGDTADVMTIAIAPAGRRRGLGTLLLDTLVTRTRARGEHHLLLEVRADNTAALALYGRAGFTTSTTRRRYYPGDVDAHVMRLTLEGAS